MSVELRVGIDVGGTFTDLVAHDEEGEVATVKVSSTPTNPAIGVMDALRELGNRHDVDPGDVESLFHGSTVTTNAIIERDGANTGLLITDGYDAVPIVGNQARSEANSIDAFYEEEPFLVPPRLTREIPERTNADSEVIHELDEEAVKEAVRELREEGVDAIAVCYLFSFLNPEHEKRTLELIQEVHPDCFVSLSSRVIPKVREYPRLSTTSVDAYVGPVLEEYITDLRQRLDEYGVTTDRLYLMLSNGGLTPLTSGNKNPSETLLSGPAAGVQGSRYIGTLLSEDNLLTMDMGGTSCDISIIKDGEVTRSSEGTIGDYRIAHPLIDITAIGAGGGTQARVEGDRLLVGPQSSGADPGPVCYGRGGEIPTVTDANVLLGRLNPDYLLGGELEVEFDRTKAQIEDRIAEPLEMDVREAAAGIVEIVHNIMKKEINLTLSRYGYDPRTFTLFAYGGAGPSHAARVAEMMDMRRVVVPPWPGLNSALGLLTNDIRQDYTRSRIHPLMGSSDLIAKEFESLAETAVAERRAEGHDPDEIDIERRLDLRYEQQGYELTVDVDSDPIDEERIRRTFDELHDSRFGHRSDTPVEVVNYRVSSVVSVPRFDLTDVARTAEERPEPEAYREVYYPGDDRVVETPIFGPDGLAGHEFTGPMIVEQTDTTIVAEPGQNVTVDELGNTVIEVNGRD